MPYVFLILTLILNSFSSILGKCFSRKFENGVDPSPAYNLISHVGTFLAWIVLFILDPSFTPGVLIYSALFSVSFVVCNIGLINALRLGPAALNSLFISLSLIITTVWGFFFWDAELSLIVIIGLILVIISIYLSVGKITRSESGFSLKWLIYTVMMMGGNAACAIISREEQIRYDGMYGNSFMVVATGVAFLFALVVYLRSNKCDTPIYLKRGWFYPALAGVACTAVNFLVLLLVSTNLSPSLIYPAIGVGTLGIVAIFSLFVFREKMTRLQWLGVVIGATAVRLLSL